MKPVPMSKYGKGNGNCLTACVASILERGIEDLPDFSAMGSKWLKGTSEWLLANGFGCLWVDEENLKRCIVNDALCIAILKCDGEDHAVVARWKSEMRDAGDWPYEVVEEFDPNERGGFEKHGLRGVMLIWRTQI